MEITLLYTFGLLLVSFLIEYGAARSWHPRRERHWERPDPHRIRSVFRDPRTLYNSYRNGYHGRRPDNDRYEDKRTHDGEDVFTMVSKSLVGVNNMVWAGIDRWRGEDGMKERKKYQEKMEKKYKKRMKDLEKKRKKYEDKVDRARDRWMAMEYGDWKPKEKESKRRGVSRVFKKVLPVLYNLG